MDSKVVEDMAVDNKPDPAREETPTSSLESTPEAEGGAEASQEPAQPQKRKGGRKPIYATSEERKQRNRQAQAAFRERRTEYIKQLEATIKHNEEQLTTLQQSQRTAADECLMLRYKNSLLERILLEKGVDVQAELAIKTGSVNFQHPAANLPVPAAPLQRTAIQRHHARRSGQFLPKLAPTGANSDAKMQHSPQGHPTPSSHASSPSNISAKSPMVMQTGSNTPPPSAGLAPPNQQQFQAFSRGQPGQQFFTNQQLSPTAQRPGPPPQYRSTASVHSNHSAGSRQGLARQMSGGMSNAHPDPSSQQLYSDPFQKHIDRLEQEYDAQHSRSMLDQVEGEDMSDPSSDRLQGQYPPQFDQHQPRPGEYYMDVSQQGTQQLPPNQGMPPTSHAPGADTSFPTMDDIIDPNDPMLDADPFGLSASMHYPTAYAFEQPPGR